MVAHEQIMPKQKRKRKCRRCKTRTAQTRGQCTRCIGVTHDEIDAGQYTEQQAIDRGILEPAGKPGRPRKRKRRKLTGAS